MILYLATGACSLADHIALHEAGLNFDQVKVDLKTHRTEDGRDYTVINPKGYVPALLLDNSSSVPPTRPRQSRCWARQSCHGAEASVARHSERLGALVPALAVRWIVLGLFAGVRVCFAAERWRMVAADRLSCLSRPVSRAPRFRWRHARSRR